VVNAPHLPSLFPDLSDAEYGVSAPTRAPPKQSSSTPVVAGTGARSWDVALSDQETGFLEMNFGGELNLAQLANDKGVLDHGYTGHRRECSFQI
jgi:hypothetical protein